MISKDSVKVALAQIEVRPGRPQENTVKILDEKISRKVMPNV